MGKCRFCAASMAVGMFSMTAGAAQAANLEIIYWGDGRLEWLQIDGRSYTVTDDQVVAKDIYEGSHTVTFGAAGTSRSFDVYLSSGNAVNNGNWCISLELESHELLDHDSCEEMWDAYFYGY
jgi:hypothetical protein